MKSAMDILYSLMDWMPTEYSEEEMPQEWKDAREFINNNQCLYYWVYIPELNEAGTVVVANDFEEAAAEAAKLIDIEKGDEVQVHELGASMGFVYEPEEGDDA